MIAPGCIQSVLDYEGELVAVTIPVSIIPDKRGTPGPLQVTLALDWENATFEFFEADAP